MDERTEFTKEVIRLIKAVPSGKVATYGLIAQLAGKPQGSRGVGWILHSSTQKQALPWQRIIKAGGKLSFPYGSPEYNRQKTLLKMEGVQLTNSRVDLKQYLWQQQQSDASIANPTKRKP